MTTLHATNEYNVIATFNQHIETTLKAIARPAWLPAFQIVYTIPETGIVTPSISVHHRALYDADQFQGRNVSSTETGVTSQYVCELNVWVSRKYQNWLPQQRVLCAMLKHLFISTKTLVVQDYSTPTNPTATTYKINVRRLEGVEVSTDTNPDIERARFLLRYDWTQRVTS